MKGFRLQVSGIRLQDFSGNRPRLLVEVCTTSMVQLIRIVLCVGQKRTEILNQELMLVA